jgi:hypothetical protein
VIVASSEFQIVVKSASIMHIKTQPSNSTDTSAALISNHTGGASESYLLHYFRGIWRNDIEAWASGVFLALSAAMVISVLIICLVDKCRSHRQQDSEKGKKMDEMGKGNKVPVRV